MKKVVGLGEILWDVFPDGSVLGGAPGNFAMHVNSLGVEGIVVSSIGQDESGESVKNIFKKRGLKSYLVEVPYNTGTVIVSLDINGKATYDFTKNSAWDFLSITSEMEILAKECEAVCFGSLCQRSKISRDSIYKFLKLTKKDCIRIFDINIRENFYSKEIFDKSLEYANILKLNDEEILILIDMYNLPRDEESCLKSIKEMFKLDMVILTKGAEGSRLYRSKNEDSIIVPENVKIIDTVGAGDSFTAAVAVGLLNGDSLEDINIKANKVATFVCTQKGGTPKLSSKVKGD